MAQWFRCWIPNQEVQRSKSVSGSNSVFILLNFMKWVPGTPGELKLEGELSPCSGSVALKQLNPIHKKGP